MESLISTVKIKNIEPIILYAQDVGSEKELNVGGYAGFQVIVHIQTDEGIDGWGECCTGGEYGESALAVKTLIERGFVPRIKDEDPRDFRKIWEKLYADTSWFGRRGLTAFAQSGIDTALVDIAAKSYNIPASRLLGGQYRSEIPLYASLLFDMDDAPGTAEKGAKYVRDDYFGVKFGWGMIPSKPFGADPDRDEKMIAAIREAFGPRGNIMVDVGRYVNWTSDHAIRMAKRFEKYNIFWLEEALPQDDLRGYERLTDSTDVTIAFGEGLYTVYDFAEVISRRAADLIQPDASKVGGISEMKRVVELASINNVRWVPHNWSTAINSAASMQLVASAPDGFLMEFKQESNPLVSELSKEKFRIEKGKLIVSDLPGLGIEVDENVVDEYRWKP